MTQHQRRFKDIFRQNTIILATPFNRCHLLKQFAFAFVMKQSETLLTQKPSKVNILKDYILVENIIFTKEKRKIKEPPFIYKDF